MMTRGTATRIVFFGISDCGLQRQNNEDHFIVADLTRKLVGVEDNRIQPDLLHHEIGAQGTLLAVADGLGGHEGGEIASLLAVDTMVQALFTGPEDLSLPERLTQAVIHAHKAINTYHGQSTHPRRMASTLTAIHVGEADITIAQVGDSRAYRFGNGPLTMLTEDQTVVRMMQKKGLLTEEEAQRHPHRNVILQALGQDKEVLPEIQTLPLQDGDCLLLCSDGLTSYVSHERIEAILNEEQDEYTRCRRLVEAANAAGGSDNVTVLLARVIMPAADRVADDPVGESRESTVGQPKKKSLWTTEIKFPWSSRSSHTEDSAVETDAVKHNWTMALRVPWFNKSAKDQESAVEPVVESPVEPVVESPVEPVAKSPVEPAVESPVDSPGAPPVKSSLWQREIKWRRGNKASNALQPEAEQPRPFPPSVPAEYKLPVGDALLQPSATRTSLLGFRDKKAASAGPLWNPDVLKFLEDHLAQHIGPVAKIMVGRAAGQTGDVYELCQVLATQLPSEQEQKSFLQAVAELVAHYKR